MDQVIIHIDLDFFYGQVEQAANPSLYRLPFAIQQKHIVVTCNYLARAAGIKKLQLLTDARRCCPSLVIVNGEDIQRYRNASKAVFRHVRALVGEQVERLGMDELWLDVTTHVVKHYESTYVNHQGPDPCLFKLGDTEQFQYTTTAFSGHIVGTHTNERSSSLLLIASHLAAFLRESIRSTFSFTSSAGISTSKLIAKLIGDYKKPDNQTTILPDCHQSYLDSVEVKKIAGVGYKMLSVLYQKLGSPEVLNPRSIEVPFEDQDDFHDSPPALDDHFELTSDHGVDDGEEYKLISKQKEELLNQHKTPMTVSHVRQAVDRKQLVRWFGEVQGCWLWDILHAQDDSSIKNASLYPKSIGLEDSFLHCTTVEDVRSRLIDLTTDLVVRIEGDLMEDGKFVRWPTTLRLTPRFRGDQERGELWRHKRTSKSTALPVDVLSITIPAQQRAESLVDKVLLPLFAKIVHNRANWDLSLLNVGVADFKISAPSTNISDYLRASKLNSGTKRRGSDDRHLVATCPDGVELEIWNSLDNRTKMEILSDEGTLARQSFPSYTETALQKKVKFDSADSADSTEELVQDGSFPSLEEQDQKEEEGEAEEDWPEESEEGHLCENCSSVIPEFALEDHICLS